MWVWNAVDTLEEYDFRELERYLGRVAAVQRPIGKGD